jgi:hypothetical protein
MKFVHIKNLEKYHPGYKDRTLHWAKIYFKMVQGDPDCELITNEIDWGRLVKLIVLELEAKRPIPIDDTYLARKGFDLKLRSMSLTLQMLQNFIEIVAEPLRFGYIDKELDKEKEVDKEESKSKATHLDFVTLSDTEYNTLKDRYGETVTKGYIERLNNYAHQKPKKFKEYASHYHTIIAWMGKDGLKKKVIETPTRHNQNVNIDKPFVLPDKTLKQMVDDLAKSKESKC